MSLLDRFFSGWRRGPENISIAEFAERYAAFAQNRVSGAKVSVHQDDASSGPHVAWIMQNGTSAKQFFGNWYARYLQDESRLEDLFSALLDDALALDISSTAPSSSAILPLLKPGEWPQVALAQMASAVIDTAAAPFIVQPFAGDLVITYVLDTPDNMQFVKPSTLAAMSLDEASLHRTSMRNLDRLLPSVRIEANDGWYAARLDGYYDASLLLITEKWRDRVPIAGDLILSAPARDQLLMCSIQDGQALAAMAVTAAKIRATSPYVLGRRLLRWSKGELTAA